VKILDRLPVGDKPEVLFVGAEAVTIKRYQIAVWASLNDATRPFPAVLDTGLTHNFSITESLLRRWAGLTPNDLKSLGTTRLKGETLVQYRGDLRLHRNRPGTVQLGEGSHPLSLDQGFSLMPEGSIRLPLLGLRSLIRNNLRLTVDGKRGEVTLKTAAWW
jgi:hypothetical protein